MFKRLVTTILNSAQNQGRPQHPTQGPQDIPQVTNFLKNNDKFKKAATKIHISKQSAWNNISKKFDEWLSEEDKLKFLEDKSNKNKKK